MPDATRRRDWAPLACAIVGVAAVVSVSLHGWELNLFRGEFDPSRAGTWAQVLSGVGTTTAVSLTLAGLWMERRRRAREAREADDRQLTDVHAWLSPAEGDGAIDWQIVFNNRTHTPVYQWNLALAGFDTHLCSRSHGPIRPEKTLLHVAQLRDLNHARYPPISLFFATGDGRAWVRKPDGSVAAVAAGELACHADHGEVVQAAAINA